MSIKIDVVLDGAHGDCGKGILTHHFSSLPKEKGSIQKKYTHCLRFNGGGNAGHTIYHNGKKMVTHIIPTGIIHGIKSIVGNNCVLNVNDFLKEIRELEESGIDTKNKIFVSRACHIVTDEHLQEERNETKIGTTKKGIGPAYRDKATRTGIRAESVKELEPYLIDMYEEFYCVPGDKVILAEGAQGFYLDIDLGDYPYVTSSNCGIGALLNNGFNHNHVRDVWVVAKVYETYVGSKKFHSNLPVFDQIRIEGKEFGATTGRPRQCNILNLDSLIKSCRILGATHINLRKLDILEKVNFFRFVYCGTEFDFDNSLSFQDSILNILHKEIGKPVFFSSSPETI